MSSATSDSPRSIKRIPRIAVFAAVGLVTVCLLAGLLWLARGGTFRMMTPENFAKVKFSRSAFGALTPQEDKLVVRHFSLREKQNLPFWVDGLRNHFVEDRGYTLKEEDEFKTDAGLSGHRFLFEIAMNDVPYCYELVLFTTAGWFRQHIYTAELLCGKKNFDKHGPAVENALKRFQARRGHAG